MHILFLTDNFPPEGNAPASRTYEHAKEWIKSGHKVTVITCAPNFPEGKVFKGYKNSWYTKEVITGIEVRRVKTYITSNEGFVKRILDYQSFMFTSFIASFFVKKIDVIVATSPQFFTACSGWAVSLFRRRPFVFELRDIWPASITAVGAMKDSYLIKFLEKIELFLYKRASMIISVTNSFKNELINRGVDGNKIKVVLNGVDLSQYEPLGKDQAFVEKYNLKGKFVAGYIGTHGMAHSLETLVEAAEILKDNQKVVFLFAGGGAAYENIRVLANAKNLDNVRFLGRVEKQIMPKIWSLCDISIVHLKNTPLFRSVIPSKIFESMGMGLPILIGQPLGEATDIIKMTQCGMVFESESSSELASNITKLLNNNKMLNEFKTNSINHSKNYDRKLLAKKMLDILMNVSIMNE
ncbi:MAG: glycosyltransferase family 4 protein [Gammaproteobacteria bacterium]|nr:glycosyltransferase family 4 protein [Gammaproteobacteria bacterium]